MAAATPAAIKTLHAVGLVVNVDDTGQLAQLKQIGAPLELYALPGSQVLPNSLP